MTGRLLRWLLWVLGALTFAAIGLAVADTLHSKTCPAGDFKGQTVQIPGERMHFVATGRETDGESILLDTVREPFEDPNYQLHPEDGHVHPHQEEHFEVIAGGARFLIGDREVVLTAGQRAMVPPNTVHHWMALDGRPVHVMAEFRPALDTAEWFTSFHGHIDRNSMNLFRAVVIQSEFDEGAPWPAAAPWLWKVMVKVLAPVGRLLGYTAC